MLTPKQRMAISELTKSENSSYKEIARKVGISISTLSRWRTKPEFSLAIEESFHELKEEVESKVMSSISSHSLHDIVNYLYIANKTVHIDYSILRLICDTQPQVLFSFYKYASKADELNTKLNNLKSIFIEIEEDIQKVQEDIVTLNSLLR